MNDLHKFLLRLSRADMVFYLMPLLMVLLVAGTVAQRWMGLYEAHQMFFSSFIFWAGGVVPLPGGYLVLGVLSVHLVLKFFLASAWSWPKAGIILTHLGALILLVGGLLTAIYAQERYMIIGEGEETPYLYDYIERDLAIYSGDHVKIKIPFDRLGQAQEHSSVLPFRLEVLQRCSNCEIAKREDMPEQFGQRTLRNLAQFMALKDKPDEQSPEENIAGVVFDVSGLDEEQNGVYLAIEGMPAPVVLSAGERQYQIMLGKAQSALPFSIKLTEFKKEAYPGMDKAKAYSSEVVLRDGAVEWPAIVEMNKPLRYKGYTFFQSSFERTADGREASIFAVVENKGRLLPYIGTIILALGLMLHIFIVQRERMRAA